MMISDSGLLFGSPCIMLNIVHLLYFFCVCMIVFVCVCMVNMFITNVFLPLRLL